MKGVHSTPRLPLFGMQIAGATLGLRVTLLLGGLGLVVATLFLALLPIWRIRDLATTGESSARP